MVHGSCENGVIVPVFRLFRPFRRYAGCISRRPEEELPMAEPKAPIPPPAPEPSPEPAAAAPAADGPPPPVPPAPEPEPEPEASADDPGINAYVSSWGRGGVPR